MTARSYTFMWFGRQHDGSRARFLAAFDFVRQLRYAAGHTSSLSLSPDDFLSRECLSNTRTVHEDSTRFLAWDRCVTPVACLIALLVGLVTAFWSCPYLADRAYQRSDNGQASGRPSAHAGTGRAPGHVQRTVMHDGRRLITEVSHRRTRCASLIGFTLRH